MDIDEIKAYTNGDEAVRLGYRRIYDWHLTHVSESNCKFTNRSLEHAIKHNDVELVKQLLNIGVDTVNFHSCLFDCRNYQILELMLPKITLTKHEYSIFVYNNNTYAIDYMYNNNYLTDEFLHNILNSYGLCDNKCDPYSINRIANSLKYISDKGYRWSYKHCENFMLTKNIELIQYLWKNGNNNAYDQKDNFNKILLIVWDRIYRDDRQLFNVLCTIDGDFIRLLIKFAINLPFILYMNDDKCHRLINYIVATPQFHPITGRSLLANRDDTICAILLLHMLSIDSDVMDHIFTLRYEKSDKTIVDEKAKELGIVLPHIV